MKEGLTNLTNLSPSIAEDIERIGKRAAEKELEGSRNESGHIKLKLTRV